MEVAKFLLMSFLHAGIIFGITVFCFPILRTKMSVFHASPHTETGFLRNQGLAICKLERFHCWLGTVNFMLNSFQMLLSLLKSFCRPRPFSLHSL